MLFTLYLRVMEQYDAQVRARRIEEIPLYFILYTLYFIPDLQVRARRIEEIPLYLYFILYT